MNGHLLVVDDEPEMVKLLQLELKHRGHTSAVALSVAEAREQLAKADFDLVLTDIQMPGLTGLELCRELQCTRPDIPVVVLTGFGSVETATSAIRAGAYDFVTKPVDMELLAIAVERAITHRQMQETIRRLQSVGSELGTFGALQGAAPAMKRLFDTLSRVAVSDATVLIAGESGCGKELAARALHDHSRRSAAPFVAINCAAMPEALLESELFGHVQGAFTDARSARRGLFAAADGGTLFLDEIGDMPPTLQPKLLRALENRTIRPVGAESEVHIDVRVVAATNRDIDSMIEEGKFREDLYFRINVVRVDIPPLRARLEDLVPLVTHFIARFAAQHQKDVTGIADAAMSRFYTYEWPGNVRELKNVIEQAVLLTAHDKILATDLPERIQEAVASPILPENQRGTELLPMHEVERRHILQVLSSVNGNRGQAARILALDRKTLWRKLRQYGVVDSTSDSTTAL